MIPTTDDRETFLLRLRQSGLLTGAQYRDAAHEAGTGSEAVALARSLVRRGLLTRFQARMLLHGRTDGFFVGPYRILEQVGRGGMGRVYKAVHQTLDRTVALKILSPRLVRTAKARELFRNEAQTAARLNHPSIVQAYDAGEGGGLWYLAMEFVAGVTLSQLVHQRGALPVGLACEVIRQAALGLQHAHAHGLVHRDIKPANLMISVVRSPDAATPAVQVKVLDFGLARLQRRSRPKGADADTGRHPITGTPDFMSPEQARDRDAVDIRSDLYSLGCTFYYLLTGRVPFSGGGMLDKLIRHSSELPVPPDKVRPRVPAAVGAIVSRLMAKDPADRFQTPQEVADAVAPYAAVPDLSRGGRPRRSRAAAEPTTPSAPPGEKTLGPDDTAPQASLPTEVTAEQEALASWVADQLGERRHRRRRFRWVALAGGLLGAAAAALAWWWQPW